MSVAIQLKKKIETIKFCRQTTIKMIKTTCNLLYQKIILKNRVEILHFKYTEDEETADITKGTL